MLTVFHSSCVRPRACDRDTMAGSTLATSPADVTSTSASWRVAQPSAAATGDRVTASSRGRRCTCSMCGATPKASQARMAILSAASRPSRSRSGMASAKPRACASRTASAREVPARARPSTKLLVPLSTPRMAVTRTPAAPDRSARTTGMLPPTAPSKSRAACDCTARAASEAPCAAISALFAVTTRRPARSDSRTTWSAGSIPPSVSTTRSAAVARKRSRLVVSVPAGMRQPRGRSARRTSTLTRRTSRPPGAP